MYGGTGGLRDEGGWINGDNREPGFYRSEGYGMIIENGEIWEFL